MIWNFCIKRPVLTVVAFLILAIFGILGYSRMPVRENPDVEFPVVSVNVVLPGAEPQVMETEVIEPLEEEINTIEGLKQLSSTAREQVATIVAEFELWRDIDIAAQDIRDRIDRAERELPSGIEKPIVRKLDPDAQAVMWIALVGDDRWDAVRLSEYADENLKERLENLRGVGRVIVGGERRYAVRVRLDADKLAAHSLTVQDVVSSIQQNNVDIPSGRIESERREFLVRTSGQFESAAPINDLIIAFREGSPTRIRDVGLAVDGVENDRQLARFKGATAVGLGIVKQSEANTVALAGMVKRRMAAFSETFPPGLTYTVASDDSEYIQDSINDLLFTVFLTTALVVLVVLTFLRNLYSTIITSLAVPASLLGGLALMYLLGFSINNLTMLALILSIGIVIDDAIVVVENSYRHMEQGAETKPAARVGTTEVAFPAVANTLSLGAVFIPVAFTAGLIGRFFFEFGLTVAATVFCSTLTALTLTAMLCSRLMKPSKAEAFAVRWPEAVFNSIGRLYAAILNKAMGHRIIALGTATAIFFLGVFFFTRLKTEFAPRVDRSQFIISFELPEGATLSQTDAFARRIESVLSETDEVKHFFLAIGLATAGGPGKVNQGIVFVRLLDRRQRRLHQSEVVDKLRARLQQYPQGRAYVIESSPAAVQAEAPLQVVLQHPDLDQLASRSESILEWMRGQRYFTGANSDLKMNKPQVRVLINRQKASEADISVAQISNTLRFMLGEPDISEVERNSERYEVITEVSRKGKMVPSDIERFYLRSPRGQLVSMANVATLVEDIGPSEIHHFNRMRSVTISSSLPGKVTLGEALSRLEAHLSANIPGEFQYELAGQTKDFRESFYNLTIVLLLAVIFIYLVLAAQFESFLQPLIILLSLPLALVGAFAALWAFRMPFGIVAFIGLIMLMGMATKNAILLVDYSNVLCRRGHQVREAAARAAGIRFRPVLMTTISTVFGVTPIALGYGAGGEARAPMGVAVVFGLLATTLLTLIVIPVFYTLVTRTGRPSQN